MKQVKKKYFQNLPNNIVVVDFFAEWCNPCKMLMPFMEEIDQEYKNNEKIEIVKANIEDVGEITEKYSIMSVPTILFFYNGKVVDFLFGFTSKKLIKEKINNLL